jgi:hypothetical protein
MKGQKGFQPGNKLAGSRKGSPNKITADIKEAVLKAFTEVGGWKWLVRLAEENPKAFAVLLAKLLPNNVNLGDANGEPITITIRGYDGNKPSDTSAS